MATKKSRLGRRLVGLLAAGPLLMTSGCGVPSLHLFPSSAPAAPTIMQLQDHITCTLVDALETHLGPTALAALAKRGADRNTDPQYQLWQKMVEYNVQDTVVLTVAVTQTQGFSPSLSFITPLTALGHPIEQIVDSSNGITTPMNVTSGAYNRTLSIGAGVNGTQVHNVVLTYTMDLHKIYDAMYDIGADGVPILKPDGAKKWCDDLRATKSPAGVSYGLKGDLALVEALDIGLNSLDRGRYSPALTANGSPPGASPSGSMAVIAPAAGASGFSSKIDFSLGWGLNGGPNWTLLFRKGPTGGNTQPLSYTRSKQDTLISTFTTTCRADRTINLMDSRYFYAPVLFPQAGAENGSTRMFEIRAYMRRVPDLTRDPKVPEPLPFAEGTDGFYGAVSREFYFDIAVGKDDNKLQFTYSGAGTGAVAFAEIPLLADKDRERPPNMNGTIAVSSFSTNNVTSFSYSIRGALSDGLSGAFVGNMHAGVTVTSPTMGRINNLDISQNALRLILEESGRIPTDGPTRWLLGETGERPKGYWASLPSCATAAPFLLNNQSLLQQLPRNVSDTLVQ